MVPSSSSSLPRPLITNTVVKHVNEALLPKWFRHERTRVLYENKNDKPTNLDSIGSVVYWMQRDVRAVDNWALLLADSLAHRLKVPLRVMYVLPPPPPPLTDGCPSSLRDLPLTERYGSFLLQGLECVHHTLHKKNIPLHVLQPSSHDTVGTNVHEDMMVEVCCKTGKASLPPLVICDFSPLREPREWIEQQFVQAFLTQFEWRKTKTTGAAVAAVWQVDAHNIVPVWVTSNKREVGARTLRPRIHKHVDRFLQKFPNLKGNAKDMVVLLPEFNKSHYIQYLQWDESVKPATWAQPGPDAAMAQFKLFCQRGLPKYEALRNDPTQQHITSDLSPWINHGHISFQRIMMNIQKLNKYATGSSSFIEEGLVRRELSDNFVYYSPNDYDKLTAAYKWAQETLQVHASDPREYTYTVSQLEHAETHDPLWNAAQRQVVQEGRMHGFLRMYWAKKILEWSEPPAAVALQTAQYLNDKYALDGRDPNGFVGVGWSIMGIHDQGWGERAIFGKIRYMTFAGCQRKFNVAAFTERYPAAAPAPSDALPAATNQTVTAVKRKPTSTTKANEETVVINDAASASTGASNGKRKLENTMTKLETATKKKKG